MAAWAWVLLPPIMWVVVLLMGTPYALPEPSDINAMFRGALLFTRAGDSFRFVAFEQRANVKPLWSVSPEVMTQSSVERRLGAETAGFHLGLSGRSSEFHWSGVPRGSIQTDLDQGTNNAFGGIYFGFYKRTLQCRWLLSELPFDEEGRKQSSAETSLSDSEIQSLKPLVIAELNRRSGEKHWGDVLDKALKEGRARSSYVCLQNAFILAGWLSVLWAFLAVGSMFFGKSGAAKDGLLPG
jgi:hypothetical protein